MHSRAVATAVVVWHVAVSTQIGRCGFNYFLQGSLKKYLLIGYRIDKQWRDDSSLADLYECFCKGRFKKQQEKKRVARGSAYVVYITDSSSTRSSTCFEVQKGTGHQDIRTGWHSALGSRELSEQGNFWTGCFNSFNYLFFIFIRMRKLWKYVIFLKISDGTTFLLLCGPVFTVWLLDAKQRLITTCEPLGVISRKISVLSLVFSLVLNSLDDPHWT